MAFLDRLSKAVTGAVDRASKGVSEGVDWVKREADQMARINRVQAEIRDVKKQNSDLLAQISAIKVQLGEKALEMLQAGTLVNPDLQGLSDQISGFEQQIAANEALVAEKEAAIEAIKAEDVQEREAARLAAEESTVEARSGEITPPPPLPVEKSCSQCGATLPTGSAFCSQCGTKQE